MRFIADSQPTLIEGWTVVETYVANGRGIPEHVEAMRQWLDDDARPGEWYWWASAGDSGRARLTVYLSDPTVAFEFKVRWG